MRPGLICQTKLASLSHRFQPQNFSTSCAPRIVNPYPLIHSILRSNSHITQPLLYFHTKRNTMAAPSSNPAHFELEEKALSGGSSKKSGGRGRGGSGGGGQTREVQVSRALSKLLRHHAENAGIKLDNEGFAPLERVLAYGPIKSLKSTLSEIQSIVATNDKQRFSLKTDSPDSTNAADYLIRANQGHSIKVESSALLVPIKVEEGNVPKRVLHGTYFAFWPAIEASGGLKPMGRNHVHCSTGTPEDGVVSGMRRDAEVLIEIDVARSITEGGLKWWRSDNDVLLTEGDEDGMLSAKYFKRVCGRKDDVGVLWEDGVKVGDLPEGLKKRVPHGKGSRGQTSGRGRGSKGGNRGGASHANTSVES